MDLENSDPEPTDSHDPDPSIASEGAEPLFPDDPADTGADRVESPSEPKGVDGDPSGGAWQTPQERLDRRVIGYWIITGSVGWLVLAAIAGVLVYVFADHVLDEWFAFVVAGGALLGLLLLWTLISPSLAYARWRYSIDDELLRMRYGIVYHEEKAIPVSRLQHVDLLRGPLERMFGLATLVVFTAGTEAASFRVSGLSVARAQELRDQILAARGDDVI